MHLLRRRIDEVDIAGVQIVRRQEFAHEDHRVEDCEENAGRQRQSVALELPPHQHDLRGHVDLRLLVGHRLG